MFRTVLVANRGEIACRIMATLRERAIRAIAVYSDADSQAPHVRLGDLAVRIGPPEPRLSYLNIEAVIEAARRSDAQAIHPGYGFLAENPDFADAVEAAGLAFVGPTPEQVRSFGDKRAARAAAEKAGVPVVPGFELPPGSTPSDLLAGAKKLGFPVIVKAALGGGGKGMRVVERESDLAEAIASASRVAASAFGEGSVYLEKALERPRHVEVQVVGDGKGEAVHFFERECSLQRRHQKVLEETPSPGIDESTRQALCQAAVALARSVSYRGAGTMEFLVEPGGRFYFLEANTRLQVEHPVTEMTTGSDLVWLQLVVASEGALPLRQSDIARAGHAVEVRVYAEDPSHDFLPQAGKLSFVSWPHDPFVRVDAGADSGNEVPVHYDPILAKIIAWGPDRETAVVRLSTALENTIVHGVANNVDFLRALVCDQDVLAGHFDTTYLERRFLSSYFERARQAAPPLALAAALVAELLEDGARAVTPTAGATEPNAADPFARLGPWRQPGLE